MIGNTFQFQWEVNLIVWCQARFPSFVIEFVNIASYLGDTIFLVLLIAIFYLCYDKQFGRRIVYNTITSLVFVSFIKNIIIRRRPYFDNPKIKCLKIIDKDYDLYDVEGQGFSFPSMHSSNISVVSGSLYENYKKKIILIFGIIISFIVGVSRFILGCHYPTDVIAGWLIGVILVIILNKLQDKLEDKYLYIITISIGVIGLFISSSSDFLSSFGIAIGYIACDIFDKKIVNFKNTNSIWKMILRLLIAGVVFLSVSECLKIIFSNEIAEIDIIFKNIFRVFRYALATFAGFGLTTILYKYDFLK